jgi:hypothetical protein
MTSFKKLFAYALLFVATFSLTALSCEDLTEDLTVNVPTEIKRTIQLSTTATGAFSVVEKVDIASDEFKENREKMKDYTIETLDFDVVDNLTGGSAIPTGTTVDFYAGSTRVSTGSGVLSGATFEAQLNSLDPSYVELLKEVVEVYLLDDPNPYMDITFKGNASGPMDYTITFTMTGTIKAAAK